MKLAVADIKNALDGTYLIEPANPAEVVCGVTWDSRTVVPGNLYVALVGERVDGHDFAAAAFTAGARFALVTHAFDDEATDLARKAGIGVMMVDDMNAALAQLAGEWRTHLSGKVIGLTGSTGKTTTKNLVRTVLEHAGTCIATEANQNNELGVPRTVLRASADTDFVVVEMGMRGTGQIAELCSFVKPDWGLITNVGETHIELLGSRENILHAKAELFEALPDDGMAFVNAADENASELVRYSRLQERGVKPVFFEGGNEWKYEDELCIFDGSFPFVWASDITLDDGGCPTFLVHSLCFPGCEDVDDVVPCTLQLAGVHNVSNACSAIAVGLAAGMSLEGCVAAVESAQPEKGRQQILQTDNGITVVDDTYNANPDSMRASLATFAAMSVKGRRIAVLGDMAELGDFAFACHRRVGEYAAHANLDILVCVGPLSRAIAEAAVEEGFPDNAICALSTTDEAVKRVRELARPGDAVLAKASRWMEFEKIVEGLVG